MCADTGLIGILSGRGRSSPQSTPVPVPATEGVQTNTREAKERKRRARGVSDTIFSSVLGDSGFGDSVVSASKLGGTS